MDDYKQRIIKYIQEIENSIDILLHEKSAMEKTIQNLTEENTKLREVTRKAISQVDGYIVELEEIRRQHVGSNNIN